MYNGRYETLFDVIINGETHDECLQMASVVKLQCKAWQSHDVRLKEHRSARKGDVLKRSLMIYQTAHAHEIIIFREAVQCLMSFPIFLGKVVVKVRYTTPIDTKTVSD